MEILDAYTPAATWQMLVCQAWIDYTEPWRVDGWGGQFAVRNIVRISAYDVLLVDTV